MKTIIIHVLCQRNNKENMSFIKSRKHSPATLAAIATLAMPLALHAEVNGANAEPVAQQGDSKMPEVTVTGRAANN